MADEKFLRSMGATSQPVSDDPHAGCLQRWLDEREKRERAEQSILANAQAYERLSEAQEKRIDRLRALGYGAALLIVALAVALVGLLARMVRP
jgi:hypothetical protein